MIQNRINLRMYEVFKGVLDVDSAQCAFDVDAYGEVRIDGTLHPCVRMADGDGWNALITDRPAGIMADQGILWDMQACKCADEQFFGRARLCLALLLRGVQRCFGGAAF